MVKVISRQLAYSFPAMDRGLKERWVSALRSGDYEQTRVCLRSVKSRNCLCALGVLADVSPGAWVFRRNNSGAWWEWEDERGVRHTGSLPVTLLDFGTQDLVTRLNDSYGWSFDAIATWIEAYL